MCGLYGVTDFDRETVRTLQAGERAALLAGIADYVGHEIQEGADLGRG